MSPLPAVPCSQDFRALSTASAMAPVLSWAKEQIQVQWVRIQLFFFTHRLWHLAGPGRLALHVLSPESRCSSFSSLDPGFFWSRAPAVDAARQPRLEGKGDKGSHQSQWLMDESAVRNRRLSQSQPYFCEAGRRDFPDQLIKWIKKLLFSQLLPPYWRECYFQLDSF